MNLSQLQGRINLLLEGPIGWTLVRLALPMVFGIGALILFNVVDTFYVGRLGATELAAMSFTFPVVYLMMHVAVGLGVGVTSVISRAIGEGDLERVRRLTSDGLVLANTVVIVLAIGGFLTTGSLFRSLGASEDLVSLIRTYMLWLYAGAGFLVIPIVGNSAIRATGDTKTPAIIMGVAGLVNIALDPLLIFGPGPFPRLGLQGAAIATVISWVVTFVAALRILHRRLHMIDWSIPHPRVMWGSWKGILYVGVPAAATQTLLPVAVAIVTRIVASFGPDAVAAFGVGTRLEAVAMIGAFALGAAMAPFVGQNFGARNNERLRGALRFGATASLVFGGLSFIVLALLARPLASLFNDQQPVISAIVTYLRIMPLGYAFQGYLLLSMSSFNAANRPVAATVLRGINLFLLGVPFAYLGSRLYGFHGVFVGLVAANLLTGVISFLTVRKFLSVFDAEVTPSAN